MKSKIFNPFLFALTVLLTVSSITFAQITPVPPVSPKPLPPPPASAIKPLEKLDDKDFQLKMDDLKIQMKDLQVKMNALNKLKIEKTMKLNAKKFKSFSKNFNFKFDSLKRFTYKSLDSNINYNFSYSTDLAPKIAYGFKDFDDNFTFYNSDDYNSAKRNGKDDGVEKTKNYTKIYSVDGDDVINIDNRFGKITVTTWAKNEVRVDVQIKVVANDDEKAQKFLDNVSIKDSKDGSNVYFKTYIDSEDNNGSWGSVFGGKRSSSHSININYTVYMPVKSALNITNKYGSTNLPDLDGKLNINNSYGSLVTKVLSHTGNQIKVRYGSANIGSLNDSELDVAYGSLDIGDCNKLNADVSYGSAKIGRITTSGNINLKFGGGLNVNEVDKNVKNLSVTSSYSSVKLGIGSDHNADFDVTVHYGSFNYDGHDVNITSKTPADGERGFNPTKNYKGHLGKGASEKTITVTSNYGSVKFD